MENQAKNLIVPVEKNHYMAMFNQNRRQRKAIRKMLMCMLLLLVALGFCLLTILTDSKDAKYAEYEEQIQQLEQRNAVLQTRVNELKDQNEALQEKANAATYPLTAAERELICGVVMAEAGGQGVEGQMLVAQCIRNACEIDGIDPSTAIERYQYAAPKSEVTDEVKRAVSAVFDEGLGYTDEAIMYFYAPDVVYSAWHETQDYVLTHDGHKFFCRKG